MSNTKQILNLAHSYSMLFHMKYLLYWTFHTLIFASPRIVSRFYGFSKALHKLHNLILFKLVSRYKTSKNGHGMLVQATLVCKS